MTVFRLWKFNISAHVSHITLIMTFSFFFLVGHILSLSLFSCVEKVVYYNSQRQVTNSQWIVQHNINEWLVKVKEKPWDGKYNGGDD